MVYTTNVVEGFNSALRKVTMGKSFFPNDEAVSKALFLSILTIVVVLCALTVEVANYGHL